MPNGASWLTIFAVIKKAILEGKKYAGLHQLVCPFVESNHEESLKKGEEDKTGNVAKP
jgi:hypothetical protein